MTLSMISINTQNIIREMKEHEERENELKAYCGFVNKLTREYEAIIDNLNIKYENVNKKYWGIYISESENKLLSKELQHEIEVYGNKRSKYYFKMMKYRGKINMIRTMYDAYIDTCLNKLK